MADKLAVWLYGDHVASIERDRRGPRLTYTDTALERYSLGTPLLTLALPVAERTYPQGVVRRGLRRGITNRCCVVLCAGSPGSARVPICGKYHMVASPEYDSQFVLVTNETIVFHASR